VIASPRSSHRRFVSARLVITGIAVLLGAFAAWRLATSHSTPTVGWTLASAPGAPAALPDAGNDTTIVLIRTDWWPGCSPWGDLGKDTNDESWLTEEVTYTPLSVTVTLHESDAYVATKCGLGYDYWGIPVEIHLSEPLGGRAVFDGSSFPPAARPYR
jgi:hypothetical protein